MWVGVGSSYSIGDTWFPRAPFGRDLECRGIAAVTPAPPSQSRRGGAAHAPYKDIICTYHV